MSESSKTATFVGVAVVVMILAWISAPGSATLRDSEIVGKPFCEFDPLAARRLKVTTYNAVLGEPTNFEVAQVNQSWRIPSKSNYPADVAQQLGDAVNSVNDKEVLHVASRSAADHKQYGVLDPADKGRKLGDEGVGTRVTIKDENGDKLADVIIGKQVKGEDDQYYVRETSQEVVLVSKVDPSKLSTSFADWIEKDLLQLSTWDIKQLQIKDYHFEIVAYIGNGGIRRAGDWDWKGDLVLNYDDDATDNKWSAASLKVIDEQSSDLTERPLGDDQQINTETLSDLTSALSGLRLVDVERKPSQLRENLQAPESFAQGKIDDEAFISLARRGFVFWQKPEGEGDGVELYSSEGEIIVTLNTGVEYVLRFGEAKQEIGAESTDGSDDTASGANVNRYVFVLARFVEDAIDIPEYEELPAWPEGATEEEIAQAEKDAEKKEDESDEDAQDADADADTDADNDVDNDAESRENDDADGEETIDRQVELVEIAKERKRIESANADKRTRYETDIEDGKKKVKELNERFGDWYYVIDDKEYQRIHIGYDQIVKPKEAEEESENAAKGDATTPPAIPGLPNLQNLPSIPTTSPTDDAQSESPDSDALDDTATDANATDDSKQDAANAASSGDAAGEVPPEDEAPPSGESGDGQAPSPTPSQPE